MEQHWIEAAKTLLAARREEQPAEEFLDSITPVTEEQATIIATARVLVRRESNG